MLEMGTSGLMSGEGKRVGSSRFRYRALPRLYGDQLVRIEKMPLCEGEEETGYAHGLESGNHSPDGKALRPYRTNSPQDRS